MIDESRMGAKESQAGQCSWMAASLSEFFISHDDKRRRLLTGTSARKREIGGFTEGGCCQLRTEVPCWIQSVEGHIEWRRAGGTAHAYGRATDSQVPNIVCHRLLAALRYSVVAMPRI